MPSVTRCELPPAALLRRYLDDGAYADCYTSDVEGTVSHEQWVEAFYSTHLFALERWVLKWVASRPSTLADVRELARGRADTFAAWRAEARAPDQLLLADFTGRTKSWLMVRPIEGGGTRLYFGSAVVPRKNRASGKTEMGTVFHALMGFHKLYSRLLVMAARSRLQGNQGST